MFTITRRNDRLPEDRAITELRRATTVPAARRIAHEVAYRFFESAEALGSPAAHVNLGRILEWRGDHAIEVALCGGERFALTIQ